MVRLPSTRAGALHTMAAKTPLYLRLGRVLAVLAIQAEVLV